MTADHEPEPDRDQRIAEYLTGELSPEERAGFERAMAADADLAAEVESAQAILADAAEWMESPPGLERADGIAVPPLLREAARIVQASPARRRFFWQGAAAAALLAAGFWAGRATEPDSPPKYNLPGFSLPKQNGNQASLPEKQEGTGAKAVLAPAPAPGQQLASLSPEEAAVAVPVRRVRDEDGRLVMETTLPGSGVHATWVIDGGFQMSGAGRRNNQGE